MTIISCLDLYILQLEWCGVWSHRVFHPYQVLSQHRFSLLCTELNNAEKSWTHWRLYFSCWKETEFTTTYIAKSGKVNISKLISSGFYSGQCIDSTKTLIKTNLSARHRNHSLVFLILNYDGIRETFFCLLMMIKVFLVSVSDSWFESRFSLSRKSLRWRQSTKSCKKWG